MKKDFNYDKDYEVDIHIWRTKGMPNSKAIIKTKNTLSVITATTSYIENLLRLGIVNEDILQTMISLAKKSISEELENWEDKNV